MAEVMSSAVELARRWVSGDDSPRLKEEFARELLQIRQRFTDAQGRPDLTGKTYDYRQTVARLYEDAGLTPDQRKKFAGLVRNAMSRVLHEYMRDAGMSDADYAYYGVNPLSIQERRRVGAPDGIEPRQVLPALKLPPDPIEQVLAAVQYARQALEAAPITGRTTLTAEARRELIEDLRALQRRVLTLLRALDAE